MAKYIRKVFKKKKSKKKTEDIPVASEVSDDYEELHLYEVEEESRYDHVEFNQNAASVKPEEDQPTESSIDLNYLLVAAIDLGTAASGYAFSFRNDFKANPLKISTHIWTAATTVLRSAKTPTCILFNPEGHFEAFGYEAQNKFSSLITDEENVEEWYYFENFKMSLYECKDLTFHTEIKATNGKPLPAITVFSESIKYLKNHLTNRCLNMTCGLKDEDILWTLTVPAIWNDKAKLFMRRAAEMAGIPRSQLLLALEPEAGAIFCKHIPVEVRRFDEKDEVEGFQNGSRYMVIDAGGGTVDITIHEVVDEQNIREIYAANGGPWGGNNINKAFIDFLNELFGVETFEEFQRKCVDDCIDIIREFETKKQTMKIDDSNAVIRVPIGLTELFKMHNKDTYTDVSSRIKSLEKYESQVEIKKDKLILKGDLFFKFFIPTVDKIVRHVDGLLKENENIDSILLIGGFADSDYLQNRIKTHFKSTRIIIPDDASLSVLKGAVIFGHDSRIVSSRVLKCSYGIECSNDFIEGVHDKSKLYTNPLGIVKCRHVFGIIAKMGQSVERSCASKERYLLVDEPHIERAEIAIYVSTIYENPKYITDEGCRKIGYFVTRLKGDKDSVRRKLYFSLKFGETEVKVLCRQDGSTEISEKLLDLLGEDEHTAISTNT
ncbi:heat shock 70 kDa protein 12B-like [Mytilus edulis]|uniref:heat shock 70 kDa protein 12B-like n=1 Tax=Mytilus edulis TaxID=6550 RepID=UPI0039EFB067